MLDIDPDAITFTMAGTAVPAATLEMHTESGDVRVLEEGSDDQDEGGEGEEGDGENGEAEGEGGDGQGGSRTLIASLGGFVVAAFATGAGMVWL